MEEKKKSSPVWLIIMLCIIILLLFWIVNSAKQQQLVNSFNLEIEKLNQQIDTLQKEKALQPTPTQPLI